MGSMIVKLDADCYVEWSTVVDAPVTSTMTLEQLREYVREEYGKDGLGRLPARLERCELAGTSSLDGSTLDTLLAYNRAGEGESLASREEIIRLYSPENEGGGA